jgi:hypothetical protein
MNCHSQIWPEAPVLAPVRESFRDDVPLVWHRVNDLPDFAYFDHSIHLHKGVACTTCHGEVATMPLTWKAETLYMEWCLECHFEPGRFIGPRDQVFAWTASAREMPSHSIDELVAAYNVQSKTDCSICHR